MSKGATKVFRVSYLAKTERCRCVDCISMDPAVDHRCYAAEIFEGAEDGIEIPNPTAWMDYCPFYDEAKGRKEKTE